MVLPTASWLLLCVALQICRVLSCKVSHAVPPIIPADSAGAVRVIIVGHGFSTDRSGATLLPNVNITCHGRGGLSGSEFIQRDSQARLLNDTAVECYLNPVPVHLAVSLSSSPSNLQYRLRQKKKPVLNNTNSICGSKPRHCCRLVHPG